MRSLDARSPERNCSNVKQIAPASSDLDEALFETCQMNRWLCSGGPTRMNLPSEIEELPYVFLETNDIERLTKYFCRSERRLREGVIYKDLAFVQQIDCGDEWWTLKLKEHYGRKVWVPFESLGMRAIAQDERALQRFVECLHEMSPLACEVLAYEVPDNLCPPICNNKSGFQAMTEDPREVAYA